MSMLPIWTAASESFGKTVTIGIIMLQEISCRIIIVDDMPDFAESMSDVLCTAGFEDIIIYTDPVKALAELRNNTRPAIVITDFNMPSMTGLELLKEIDQHHPEINGVIITGRLDEALEDSHKYLVLDKADRWTKKLVGHVLQIMKSHLLALLVECPQGKKPKTCPLQGKRQLSQAELSQWLDELKPKEIQAVIRAHEACCASTPM